MITQHSPLPFTLKQGQGFEYLVKSDGFKILEFGLVDNPKDLVFIVTACNNFESLLEACKNAHSALKTLFYNHPTDDAGRELIKHLQSAIAKAEGK